MKLSGTLFVAVLLAAPALLGAQRATVPNAASCVTPPVTTPEYKAPPFADADTMPSAQLNVQVPPEAEAIAAMLREGMGESSRVGADLQYLSDVIGPRLTGSAGARRANDWTLKKFKEYGADSAWLEPWKFGCSWQRGPMSLRMLAPQQRSLIGESWAWAPGTKGPRAGDVVFVDATTEADLTSRFGGKLAGKWVMYSAPIPIHNNDAGPMTAEDSAKQTAAFRAAFAPAANPEETAYRQNRLALLAKAGAAGVLLDASKEFAMLNMSGSPDRIAPLPEIVIPHETYAQFHRLIQLHEPVRIEASISNSFGGPVTSYNTVAEIRGSEHPDEVVILGAHLDSWDLGTGTTDNGAGSMTVLEAARLIKASGVRPKRTIRFVLFTGEEEGLFGSNRYASAHASEMPKIQAVTVLDNGTGRIRGMAVQDRNDMMALWRSLLAPISQLGPFTVRPGQKGGTDHLSFLPYHVPGFNYDQESRGYGHTHHSQVDTFDHAVVDDLKQASTVMAVNALQLADLPSMLPHEPQSHP